MSLSLLHETIKTDDAVKSTCWHRLSTETGFSRRNSFIPLGAISVFMRIVTTLIVPNASTIANVIWTTCLNLIFRTRILLHLSVYRMTATTMMMNTNKDTMDGSLHSLIVNSLIVYVYYVDRIRPLHTPDIWMTLFFLSLQPPTLYTKQEWTSINSQFFSQNLSLLILFFHTSYRETRKNNVWTFHSQKELLREKRREECRRRRKRRRKSRKFPFWI